MPLYEVYGSALRSSMALPELRALAPEDQGPPVRWEFSAVRSLRPMREPEELGAERIYGDVHARLFRHVEGHRVAVDDTGEFDITADGRHVRWQERAESWPDFVRAHLVGRVLATTMYLDGWLPLHASAVAVNEGVIAFLAPKGFGKSSLALALTHRGARLVTDDTLPIEPAPAGSGGTAPLAWPGVHSLRVRDDSTSALGLAPGGDETREGKWLVTDIPTARRSRAAQPLAAIYLLDPVAPGAGVPPGARSRLSPLHSAVGVVAHVKIGRMLGSGAAGTMLERAASVVREVPVYRLHAVRDLAQLGALADEITAWHGGIA